MNIEIVKRLLRERLSTAQLVEVAATKIEVSVATLYRYKKDPAAMPFGKLVELGKHLGFPIGGSATWSRMDVIAGERRRLELEEATADAKGRRCIVTPSFPVTCELDQFTQCLWDNDYGARDRNRLKEYQQLRKRRTELYSSGRFESVEIINGAGYLDFLKGTGRFRSVPERLRKSQQEKIVASLKFPNIHRRVYLKSTPELPVFSWFSTDTAIIRVDDFTVEFQGPETCNELRDIFDDYFDSADLKTNEEVRDFLAGPVLDEVHA